LELTCRWARRAAVAAARAVHLCRPTCPCIVFQEWLRLGDDAAATAAALPLCLQETRRPDKYCDERVSIVQADARLLGPEFWQEHCPGGFDAVLSDM
jgi:hypothetical protein